MSLTHAVGIRGLDLGLVLFTALSIHCLTRSQASVSEWQMLHEERSLCYATHTAVLALQGVERGKEGHEGVDICVHITNLLHCITL